jgi:hypothetical protein
VNVLVVDAMVPFAAPGPAEAEAALLLERIRAAGHQADPLRLPYRWAGDQLAQAEGVRLLGIGGIDAVVTLRFPAVAVTHPHKIAWLAGGPLGDEAGSPVRAAERALLADAQRVVTTPGEAGIAEILEALA